jgi:hypothetical protein
MPHTTDGSAFEPIGLAKLVAAWPAPEVRTYRSRSGKSTWVFNRADIHQGRQCTDTRLDHERRQIGSVL